MKVRENKKKKEQILAICDSKHIITQVAHRYISWSCMKTWRKVSSTTEVLFLKNDIHLEKVLRMNNFLSLEELALIPNVQSRDTKRKKLFHRFTAESRSSHSQIDTLMMMKNTKFFRVFSSLFSCFSHYCEGKVEFSHFWRECSEKNKQRRRGKKVGFFVYF